MKLAVKGVRFLRCFHILIGWHLLHSHIAVSAASAPLPFVFEYRRRSGIAKHHENTESFRGKYMKIQGTLNVVSGFFCES